MGTVPVILAGGAGTRLWPLSRSDRPKPLLPLAGNRTLLQETVLRAAALTDASPPIVVCAEKHAEEVLRQIREAGAELRMLIAEPTGRGTAPAAAAAALAMGEDEVLAVMPADHMVADPAAWRAATEAAAGCARRGWLVAFGVAPDQPKTGFGYIKPGPPLDGEEGACRIGEFLEKPDRATAERFLADGGRFWNSGMFLFRAGTFLEELALHRPEMAEAVRRSLAGAAVREGGLLLDGEAHRRCPAESVDNAVMENTDRGAMVRLDAGWNDVGSWPALWEMADKDEQGNATAGNALLRGVAGSYVRAGERPVAVIGLEGVVVVDAGRAVLVADMSRAEEVNRIASRLEEENDN